MFVCVYRSKSVGDTIIELICRVMSLVVSYSTLYTRVMISDITLLFSISFIIDIRTLDLPLGRARCQWRNNRQIII